MLFSLCDDHKIIVIVVLHFVASIHPQIRANCLRISLVQFVFRIIYVPLLVVYFIGFFMEKFTAFFKYCFF